ncbi:50S ribosomal protein L6 [Litorilinea aerophila]|uniref:Large ribosomal subunit protein uL6 n=1 Tax=Litorilinea aerophila TaxID=1204385 RepID=A0A540VHQ0_9CHLR|nr:50S ribosomal protein L6 [Litorilinea aerophila]MCC9075926.1 50S ribosomal protein L6 [Litorilinea aerophila]OUC08453.1 50S ribosomal protein L6 [Litorilinea aerophila]GIV78716.1 MAG: 50S ribosomal protein L6 [Litorilinea sp.]
MSRIGRKPIPVPANVTVKVEKGNRVTVTGPKGTLEAQLSPAMEIVQEDGQIIVKRPSDSRHHRAQHGLTRSLLNNMVVGVTQGFSKKLEIHGVGYRAEKQGDNLVLQVGKSHPVIFRPPTKDITFEVDRDGRSLVVSGIDKCAVGELAAVIRKTRPPEPYKGKGIRYEGEYVRMKAGKAGKASR